MNFNDAIRALLHKNARVLPKEDRDKCSHLHWAPETPENGWRSYCLKCGQPAAGSCQG